MTDWNKIFDSILSVFSVGPHFTGLIIGIIHTQLFSLMVNGSLKCYVSSSRGIRQGDPLLPSLFIIGILLKIFTKMLAKRFGPILSKIILH